MPAASPPLIIISSRLLFLLSTNFSASQIFGEIKKKIFFVSPLFQYFFLH
ncbi:unnamed protein product [Meloidogyne enterolobii]|uniref:Uncharacterized protein n=1 Tax=Meloidogyne enterolobii TaxID=390850 RepID=A0ACB0ZSS9_MELEN